MLKFTDLTVRMAGRTLIENAEISIPKGVKAGLVGANGTGKTTLFKVITGLHPSDTGSITISKDWKMGQVAQEAPGTEETLLEIVLKADEERASLMEEAETATDPTRISDIHMRLADIDAYTADSRASSILAGLGFSERDQHSPASSFSGGWRMRVALAAVLFAEPDLLLLDEPTNYLDLEGALWLENYMGKYPGTVLVISHDRDMLNKVVDSIVHLEGRKLTFYRGNYDNFEKQRAEKRELIEKAREKMEGQKKHMMAFVDRFGAKASKAKQAQSKLKAIGKLKLPAQLEQEGTMPFNFPNPEKLSASPMIKLENVNCGYGEETVILNNIKLNIDADDRIALLGSNGNGKSTFSKLLVDRLPFVNGTIVKAPKIKVAMFAQHQMDDLHADQTPVDHVRKLMPQAAESQVRSKVAQMGLNHERMGTVTAKLSGGEKARLLLGLCTFHGPDLLILDEPTNHLDVGAREALVHGLNNFAGAVILVSHDRHLIDATMERLWIVSDGQVGPYEEDLDTYRKKVLKDAKTKRKEHILEVEPEVVAPVVEAPKPKLPKKDREELKKELAPLKAKITEKEKQIQKLNEAIKKLDSSLATPGLFENHPEKGEKFAKQRVEADKMLADVEESWLTLSAKYDAGMNG